MGHWYKMSWFGFSGTTYIELPTPIKMHESTILLTYDFFAVIKQIFETTFVICYNGTAFLPVIID